MKRPTYQQYYHELLEEILRNGAHEVNRRTGAGITALHGGFSFTCDLADRWLPIPGTRKLHPKSAFADLAWMISGDMDAAWLMQHTSIWSKFTESGTSIIRTAYGHRWRSLFGRDQLMMALDALRADSTNRQCVVTAWNPGEDGLGDTRSSRLNVPCTCTFVVNVVDGRANMTLLIRSSDVFVGLPYDVMAYALLLNAMAESLHVSTGKLHVTLAHAHVYDVHRDMAHECVHAWAESREVHAQFPLPFFNVEGIEASPDDYVLLAKELTRSAKWHEFNPKPELVL